MRAVVIMTQDNQEEDMEGVKFTKRDMESPSLLTEETQILDLYDRLEELQLEIALLKVHGVSLRGQSGRIY